MNVNPNVLKRFVIYMAILTFVMFTVWGFVRSFMDRPPGDYETEVCDIRLKDKKYEQALEAANKALNKTPNHRGAMMCKALVFISEKKYIKADKTLSKLIIFISIFNNASICICGSQSSYSCSIIIFEIFF